MNASLKELDRCVNQLAMKGILLYSNLHGRFPDEQEYAELFAEAERMDLPVLLHPAHPVTYEQTKGRGMMAGLGLMFDTTIALGRIILAGILDKHPRLKLVCPHVRGTLPYLIGRIDHQTQVLGRGAENIAKPPSEYLRSVYLDTVSPIPMAIQYGILSRAGRKSRAFPRSTCARSRPTSSRTGPRHACTWPFSPPMLKPFQMHVDTCGVPD